MAFESDFLVSKAQIEEYLGYPLKSAGENDYLKMQGVYRSLRDGMSSPRDYFKIKSNITEAETTDLLAAKTSAGTGKEDAQSENQNELIELISIVGENIFSQACQELKIEPDIAKLTMKQAEDIIVQINIIIDQEASKK